MVCDHSALQSGGARYVRETRELRLVLVCDRCGAEQTELQRINYAPNARRAVGYLTEITARELDLRDSRVAKLGFAALVCGAGRDQINPVILNKEGPLTEEEWAEVRRQPEFSASLLADASFGEVRDWVLTHRERPDGTGYPRGLLGAEITLEARILAVTDAYVAMTSDRPYRRTRDHREACLELLRCAGTQFDAAVVHAFVRASVGRYRHLARAA